MLRKTGKESGWSSRFSGTVVLTFAIRARYISRPSPRHPSTPPIYRPHLALPASTTRTFRHPRRLVAPHGPLRTRLTSLVVPQMVNVPKTRRTYCKGKQCRKHTPHKVTQYKTGKASLFAQGKRRYDRKQSGYGGQTKPVFHKKAKTTKKVVLRLECTVCKYKMQMALKRTKHFELGGDKKQKGQAERKAHLRLMRTTSSTSVRRLALALCMLVRGLRSLRPLATYARPALYARMMSATPSSADSSLPPKRPLSTSPPPPTPPAAASAAAADPATKRVKLSVEDPVGVPPVLVEQPLPPNQPSTSARPPASKRADAGSKARKPRQRKTKAPKPGGVEEAGAFDVIELLGKARVEEMKRLEEEEGRDWRLEAEKEWGKDKDGKDVEIPQGSLGGSGNDSSSSSPPLFPSTQLRMQNQPLDPHSRPVGGLRLSKWKSIDDDISLALPGSDIPTSTRLASGSLPLTGELTKPVFHKKAKTTKKVVLRLECTVCKYKMQMALKRTKHFELGGDKKQKGQALRPFATHARPALYARMMSATPSSADSSLPPKRPLSTSPPPPTPPAAASAAAADPATKRVKLSVEDPVGVPPVLVEQPLPPNQPSTSARPPASKRADAGSKARKPRQRKTKAPKPGGVEEAGAFDVIELLGKARVEEMKRLEEEEGRDWRLEAEKEWGKDKDGKDVEVRIVGMNDHGDGLALLTPSGSDAPTRLVSVPFALTGELVRIHLHRHEPDYYMSHGDLLEIVEPSERRKAEVQELPGRVLSAETKEKLDQVRAKFGNRVQCQYFGECSGCQYQPLAYEEQLEMKRDLVRRAFANFSQLDPSLIPEIGPTLASPLQYAYRTKLTPHFQVPPSSNPNRNKRKKGGAEVEAPKKEWEVTIGFEQKGRKRIVDIEECVIATKVINEAMVTERAKVKEDISKYKRGATLLLRDSLPPRPADATAKPADYAPSTEPHVCITDHHATVREQVGTNEFEQQAGSFFQNNNSILPSLLDYVREAIGPRKEGEERYLVDAYTGSGLFAISLADQFDHVEGVEIDKASIRWAKKNAEYNKGPGRGEVGFQDGKAEEIFKDITFPPERTTIVIDPPRKGCDELFISQLLAFAPRNVVYVSCNPRTQARDIGMIVRQSTAAGKPYRIDSARAADLFANTHHAEGVAVLSREV
ncbi:tRNA (uracil(54)-C(5))-methyltransferase [Rhodotorula toruloides]|nr:tRNA (uracil(54)-C(5))-methyltransferase [Rhodotorula toruloides]